MLVYLVVLACAVGLGLLVYRYDLYEKEPWYLLLLAMALGYGAFWVLGYVEDFSNQRLGFYGAGDHTAGQAAVAASHEELAKLLVVVLIAVVFRREFNDPMDGLIYGAFTGLGMALEESVFYLRLSLSSPLAEPAVDLAGREVARLMLHLLMGGITGFGVGMFVERARLRYWLLMAAGWFAASLLLHFLWDYLCGIPAVTQSVGTVDPYAEVFQRGMAVLLMLVAMGAFGISVVLGSRLSRERFAPDSEKRVWRW